MTKIIIILSLLFSPLFSFAQQTPLFEIPFYFEDALGNKDTLVVGYDEDASSSQLNPQFGEVEVIGPYDEIFEVRARKVPAVDPFETNKSIASHAYYPNSNCGVSTGTYLTIRLKYPPLKVSWDKDLMQSNDCRRGVFLAPSEHWALVEDWTTLDHPWMMYCLFDEEEVIIDFSGQNTTMYGVYSILDTVENVGIDTIQWMSLVFIPTTCPDLVDNVNNLAFGLKDIVVFRNPANERINLQIEGDVFATKIYNSKGVLVYSENLRGQKEINIASLPVGVYLGIVDLENGEKRGFRFVKVEG